jgi:hypothetical protein
VRTESGDSVWIVAGLDRKRLGADFWGGAQMDFFSLFVRGQPLGEALPGDAEQ